MIDINEFSHWLNQLFIIEPLYRIFFIANIAFNLGIFSVVFLKFISYRNEYSVFFFISSAGITFTHLSLFLYIFGITNIQQFYSGGNLTHIIMTVVMYIYIIKLTKIPAVKSLYIICFVHALLTYYVSLSFPSAEIRPFQMANVLLKVTMFGMIIKVAYYAYKKNEVEKAFFQIGVVIIATTAVMVFPPILKNPENYVYPVKLVTLFINTLANASLIGYLNALADKQMTIEQAQLIKLANENKYLLISQKTILEQKVSERIFELQQSNTMKDKLFATIGHDLRNAVIVLKTSLTVFDKREINTQQIKKQTDGLYNTLDNLLEWSILQLNSHVPNATMISVKDSVDDCLDFLSQNLLQKNIRIISTVEEANIYINEHQLSIILRNLISNAIKFTPVDGFIRIFSNTTDRHVELIIADSGIGIPPDLLNSLLTNMHFTSRTGTSGEKGTGLGLKLCKELIENQGGTLEITSQVNKGTHVKISFLMP